MRSIAAEGETSPSLKKIAKFAANFLRDFAIFSNFARGKGLRNGRF